MHLARYYHDYLTDWMRHREFTVSFDHDGNKVPWWAAEWADRYVLLNVIDRALESLSHLYGLIFQQIKSYEEDSRLLVLSFENVVMRPQITFPAISRFLGRELSPKTSKILERERIPRPTITHGRAFSAHNWATEGPVTEQQVYEMEADYIRSAASNNALERFRSVIHAYNRLWPSELNDFENLL